MKRAKTDDLIMAIKAFQDTLPGWWFSIGHCSVSADASCGPDRQGIDADLLKIPLFDGGFHADFAPPATMAVALIDVTLQGLNARIEARREPNWLQNFIRRNTL